MRRVLKNEIIFGILVVLGCILIYNRETTFRIGWAVTKFVTTVLVDFALAVCWALLFLFYQLVFLLVIGLAFITVWGILAYKTCPEKASFNDYLDDLFKFAEIKAKNSQRNAPVPPAPETNSWFSFNFKRKAVRWAEGVAITTLTDSIKKDMKNNTAQYHLGVCRVAILVEGNSQKYFIGIFGTWWPL